MINNENRIIKKVIYVQTQLLVMLVPIFQTA